MADEKQGDHKAHQQELARSGYILPDAAYAADPNAGQPSVEEKSGDGGAAAAETDQSSEHGYQGALLTPDEIQAAANEKAAAAGAQTGTVTYASSAAEQAAKDAGLTDADLQGVQGSGADGKLTKADVDKAAAAKAEK